MSKLFSKFSAHTNSFNPHDVSVKEMLYNSPNF